jgi:peptidoglycan/xylan/chitin deacetylase (PgdA/CDA1 family)
MFTTLKRRLIASGLGALAATRLDRAFPERYQGAGVIFMLHRVNPIIPPLGTFAPNRHLSVTPEFLNAVIQMVRARGMDIVSLDEARGRLLTPNARRFAAFTLDDGYRDNSEHAYHVFKAADAPFTVYVPSVWPTGTGFLWWRTLEDIIRITPSVSLNIDGVHQEIATETVAEKNRAFERLRQVIHTLDLDAMKATVEDMARRYGVDANAPCAHEIMNQDEIRELARDEIVTIGSHSRTHAALAKLTDANLHHDLTTSRMELERVVGRPCLHLAYPYGNAEAAGAREYLAAEKAGYHTAVTTNRGLVLNQHSRAMMELPRIPLEGDIQDTRLVEVQLAGVPFALKQPFAFSKPTPERSQVRIALHPRVATTLGRGIGPHLHPIDQ